MLTFSFYVKNSDKPFSSTKCIAIFGIIAAAIFQFSWDIRHLFPTIGEIFRHASFQVASIITTTGFATANFDDWPQVAKTVVLIMLMFIGACARYRRRY